LIEKTLCMLRLSLRQRLHFKPNLKLKKTIKQSQLERQPQRNRPKKIVELRSTQKNKRKNLPTKR